MLRLIGHRCASAALAGHVYLPPAATTHAAQRITLRMKGTKLRVSASSDAATTMEPRNHARARRRAELSRHYWPMSAVPGWRRRARPLDPLHPKEHHGLTKPYAGKNKLPPVKPCEVFDLIAAQALVVFGSSIRSTVALDSKNG